MNILKLVLVTFFAISLTACGESNESSSVSDAANEAAAKMEAATEEARAEAAKRAQELEDLENQ
ncbi:MAG: hypothetical protein P8H03_04595 [Emcibacteraceae bacterium]|nr:hypothetical protein [Emcibacteraceae bacterium]